MGTVLVVDNNKIIREGIKSLLEKHGYSVLSAASAIDGFSILENIKLPHVIILDESLPIQDGREFLFLKNRDSRLAGIPVIFMSWVDGHQDLEGVTAMALKPIKPEYLVYLVFNIVGLNTINHLKVKDRNQKRIS